MNNKNRELSQLAKVKTEDVRKEIDALKSEAKTQKQRADQLHGELERTVKQMQAAITNGQEQLKMAKN